MLDTIITPSPLRGPEPTLRERVRERQRLRRLDRVGARLARLDAVDGVLARTRDRVQRGWTQDAWFVTGERHQVGVLRAAEGMLSDRSCLVGAVVVESLPGSVTGPVTQRALSALWASLYGEPVAAVQWSAGPGVTASRARDLVQWNDAKGRQQSDVLALLSASRAATSRAATLLREELTR